MVFFVWPPEVSSGRIWTLEKNSKTVIYGQAYNGLHNRLKILFRDELHESVTFGPGFAHIRLSHFPRLFSVLVAESKPLLSRNWSGGQTLAPSEFPEKGPLKFWCGSESMGLSTKAFSFLFSDSDQQVFYLAC